MSNVRRLGLIVGGGMVYAVGAFGAFIYFKDVKDDDLKKISHRDRLSIYGQNAKTYDREIDLDEKLMGISLMRRFLMKQSKGDVLEIAAGTGRNLRYYPSDVQLTLTDASEDMLQIAQNTRQNREDLKVHFQVMPGDKIEYPDDSFDTVVDTFGLCSMDNPMHALKEMQRVCKKDGTILLLEHGRSHYSSLDSILDKYAAKHAQKWGCIWNRDIERIVNRAGLELVTYWRFHFGTTSYIIAKPSKEM